MSALATVARKSFNGKFTAKIDFPMGQFMFPLPDRKSTIRLISSGMPQGSILAGTFRLHNYVNDIPNSVPDLSLILFADDTSALTSHKDLSILNNIMNNGLSRLNTWFKSNEPFSYLKKN